MTFLWPEAAERDADDDLGTLKYLVGRDRYTLSDVAGPLQITRYEKGHLCSIFESSGFEVERFDYGKELDRHSGIYLRPPGSRVV